MCGLNVKNTPCFFVEKTEGDRTFKVDISYLKCVTELAHEFTSGVKSYLEGLMNSDSPIQPHADLLIRLMRDYPFLKGKVMKLLLSKLPHPAHPI